MDSNILNNVRAESLKRPLAQFTFIFMLIASSSLAQVPLSLHFESISINNGLSQGFVSDILQDKRGLMWFSTSDGLNKYDDNTFTVYHHDPDDSSSIGSDDLTCLFEDSKQRLWIGTRNKGLDLFDRENGVFIHIRHTEFEGLQSDHIMGITEDKTGALWITTRKGTTRMEIADLKFPQEDKTIYQSLTNFTFLFTHIKLDSTSEAGKDKYGPENIFIDSRNRVFLTTNNCLWEVDYHTKDHTYNLHRRYGYAVRDSTFIPEMLEDSLQQGLLLNKGEIIYFPNYDFKSEKEIYRYEAFQVSWGLDKKARLWLADANKFTRLNLQTGQKQTIIPVDPLQIATINTSTAVYTDRTGVVWIASGGHGILKYDPEKEVFHHILPQFYAYQLLESRAGKIVTNAFQEISIKINEPASIDTLIDVETIKKNFLRSTLFHLQETARTIFGSAFMAEF